MECSICLLESELISPPVGYCDHEMCMACWVSTGERNPLCPICRCDLTDWMASLKIKINSKVRFDDDDENLMVDFLSPMRGIQINGTTFYTVDWSMPILGMFILERMRNLRPIATFQTSMARQSIFPELPELPEPSEDERLNLDVIRSITGNDSYWARIEGREIRRASHEYLPESNFPYYRPLRPEVRPLSGVNGNHIAVTTESEPAAGENPCREIHNYGCPTTESGWRIMLMVNPLPLIPYNDPLLRESRRILEIMNYINRLIVPYRTYWL